MPPQKLEIIDSFFRDMQVGEKSAGKSYSILMNFWYLVGAHTPFEIAERGNCAYWTSQALHRASILPTFSLFPKHVWVKVFERMGYFDKDNINVVSYRRVKHSVASRFLSCYSNCQI